MTTITTYPGVYIEEDASLSLSVSSSATAVPVFAVAGDNQLISGKPYIRISNW
ncbi:phage tail sheath family protein, partial [Enterobacter hormaechei]|nr:phage tail sheath family protein [Enterobacter hormaechei]